MHVSCSVHPEKLRFQFGQKLEIAVLQGFGNGDPTLVPSVELLNRIRNHVAHRFSIDPQLVNELIRINSEDVDPTTLTDRRRITFLRNWCSGVCGKTAGHITMMIEATKRRNLKSGRQTAGGKRSQEP